MSGVCGWIGSALRDAQARNVVDDMCKRLSDGDSSTPSVITGGRCMLAAQPGIRMASVHRANSLIAAVEGQVRWQSPELAALSTERGPAVALAEAYRQHGAICLQQMHGAFSVAVVDDESGSGLIAIDRMGTRTMCFAHAQDQWIFGSNADSVVAHPLVDREISRQSVFDYLYCHVIPSPGTIYRAVQKLLPGECVHFRDGRVERRFYWQLPYHDEGSEPLADLQRRFRQLLRDATRNVVDQPTGIGAFLSGGTDSSTVDGIARRGDAASPCERTRSDLPTKDSTRWTTRASRRATSAAKTHEYYVTPQDIVDAIPVIAASLRRAVRQRFGGAHVLLRARWPARMVCAPARGRWRRRDLRRQHALRQAEGVRVVRNDPSAPATWADRADADSGCPAGTASRRCASSAAMCTRRRFRFRTGSRPTTSWSARPSPMSSSPIS